MELDFLLITTEYSAILVLLLFSFLVHCWRPLSHRGKKRREEKKKGFESQVWEFDFLVVALERGPTGDTQSCWPEYVPKLFGNVSVHPLPSPTDNQELAKSDNPHQVQPRKYHRSGILSLSRGTNHHVQREFQGWGQRPPRVSDPSGTPQAIS